MRKLYMGVIFAGHKTDDIRGLTKNRPIASIPFAGRYRIIDFALTNLTRTGINNVGILVPHNTVRSLRDHVRGGQFWDLNRKDGGIFLMQPTMENKMERTSMNAFKSNLEYFHKSKEDTVIVYPGNLIANINMKEIIESHEKSGKDLTVVYKNVTKDFDQYKNCSTVILNDNDEIERFGTVVNAEENFNLSLDIMIIKKDILIGLLMNGVQNGYTGSIIQFVMNNVNKIPANKFQYDGYAKFIHSTKNYQTINKELLNRDIREELLLGFGGISTKINDTPPALFEIGSKVSNSLVANGCNIKGQVKNSIIGRRVQVGKGAVIENSIILQSCTIEEGAEIKNVIIDKNVIIGKYQKVVGSDDFPLVIEKKSIFDN